MISLEELLSGNKYNEMPMPFRINLENLHMRMNAIRSLYNKPMIVTSGYRTKEQHKSIYLKKGVNEVDIKYRSQHLIGNACDIYDPNGDLKSWCNNNVEVVESYQLWLEDFNYTPRWVHFQTLPPLSYKRFFIP